jgi:hypothetical protein
MITSKELHPVELKTIAIQLEHVRRRVVIMNDVRVAMEESGIGDIFPTWNDEWIDSIARIEDESVRKDEAVKCVTSLARSIERIKAGDYEDVTHVPL